MIINNIDSILEVILHWLNTDGGYSNLRINVLDYSIKKDWLQDNVSVTRFGRLNKTYVPCEYAESERVFENITEAGRYYAQMFNLRGKPKAQYSGSKMVGEAIQVQDGIDTLEFQKCSDGLTWMSIADDEDTVDDGIQPSYNSANRKTFNSLRGVL